MILHIMDRYMDTTYLSVSIMSNILEYTDRLDITMAEEILLTKSLVQASKS